ncbi:MAG TPA: FAD-binding protein [Candidatus Korarchaeota archaeon]|nr:FAD-binding protein [Candidatus Korarchaeota archaeon]
MRDVIIVGAGVAGLSAALYCSRQNLETLVIGKNLGGQALLASEIQNYPGVPNTSGFELVRSIEGQAKSFGAEIIIDEVVSLKKEGEGYRVTTSSGKEFSSLTVILAFGKTPKDLGVPGEERLKGKGISYCTICDGPLFKGRTTVLVGIGEHGVESADMLSRISSKLRWIFPFKSPGGDSSLFKSISSRKNVEIFPNSKVLEVKGEKRFESLLIEINGDRREIRGDGLFVEMGYVTKTDFLKGIIELNHKGEIKVDRACRTSAEGIFAAGDVTDMPYKQAIIAASMGAIAALSTYNYIARLKGKREMRGDWRHLDAKKGDEGREPLFFAPF